MKRWEQVAADKISLEKQNAEILGTFRNRKLRKELDKSAYEELFEAITRGMDAHTKLGTVDEELEDLPPPADEDSDADVSDADAEDGNAKGSIGSNTKGSEARPKLFCEESGV